MGTRAENDNFFDEFQEALKTLERQRSCSLNVHYQPGKNWIKITLPEIRVGRYELQFVSRSGTHKRFFGIPQGEFDILAFYFDASKISPGQRTELNQHLSDHIYDMMEAFGAKIISGDWNEDWVCLGARLSGRPQEPRWYAQRMIDFINATYSNILDSQLQALGNI